MTAPDPERYRQVLLDAADMLESSALVTPDTDTEVAELVGRLRLSSTLEAMRIRHRIPTPEDCDAGIGWL